MNKITKNLVCVIITMSLVITTPFLCIKTKAFAVTTFVLSVIGTVVSSVASSVLLSEPGEDIISKGIDCAVAAGETITSPLSTFVEVNKQMIEKQWNDFSNWVRQQAGFTENITASEMLSQYDSYTKETYFASCPVYNAYYENIQDTIIKNAIKQGITNKNKWSIYDDRFSTPFKDYTSTIDSTLSAVMTELSENSATVAGQYTNDGYVRICNIAGKGKTINIDVTQYGANYVGKEYTDTLQLGQLKWCLIYCIDNIDNKIHFRTWQYGNISSKGTQYNTINFIGANQQNPYTFQNGEFSNIKCKIYLTDGINCTFEQSADYKSNDTNGTCTQIQTGSMNMYGPPVTYNLSNEQIGNKITVSAQQYLKGENISDYGIILLGETNTTEQILSSVTETQIENEEGTQENLGLTDIEKAVIQSGIDTGAITGTDSAEDYNPTIVGIPTTTVDEAGNSTTSTQYKIKDEAGTETDVQEKVQEIEQTKNGYNISIPLPFVNVNFPLYEQCRKLIRAIFNYDDTNTPPEFAFYWDSNSDGTSEKYTVLDLSILNQTIDSSNTTVSNLVPSGIKYIAIIRYILAAIIYCTFVWRLLRSLPNFYGGARGGSI